VDFFAMLSDVKSYIPFDVERSDFLDLKVERSELDVFVKKKMFPFESCERSEPPDEPECHCSNAF
jgi:hypothetical protein